MFSHYRRQQIQGIDTLLWPRHVFIERAAPFDSSGLQFSSSFGNSFLPPMPISAVYFQYLKVLPSYNKYVTVLVIRVSSCDV